MSSTDDDAARRLLSGAERIAAKAEGQSPADYVREHYGPLALANAADDADGPRRSTGGTGSGNADARALRAMDGSDRVKATARGVSPSAYLRDEYGINAARYDDADAIHAEILDDLEGRR
jgi:hypothetical protein